MQPDSAQHLQDPPIDQQPGGAAPVRYVPDVASRRVIAVGDAREIVVRPRISSWYKALLALSLVLNAVALLLLFTFGTRGYRLYRALSGEIAALSNSSPVGERLAALGQNPQSAASFAVKTTRRAVGETLASVRQIEGATIRANVPIDKQLPLDLQLPIDTNTIVTTNAPVPVVVPARITFPAGGGTLNTTVAFNLPAEMQLPVHLSLSVPVSTTVPAQFDVPINIPVRETELAGPFARLRKLLEPAAEFFGVESR